MASTIWKGYVTFGLISIPVRLFAAARTERVSFNQIHEPCHSRIKQQVYCPVCERVVERSELVKGYEAEKDSYIIVEEEELKKIAPESQESMEILEFVKLQEVDPLYFDSSYYVTPEDPGRKAYQLLLETMRKSGYAAMAKITMHQREHTIVIRPREDGLTMHTIFYANEVRAIPEYGTTKNIEVKPQEVALAEQLVQSLAAPFDPEKYEDAYQKRLTEMLEAKREGRTVQETSGRKLAPVIDLMAALQRSLNLKAAAANAEEPESQREEAGDKKPARRASANSSGERPKRRQAG
ncbi:MAG: Ku protein [Bryobacteraceae bacterium]|nr:Ku protein [Bryobacteraceae bacterium]